MLSAHRSTTTPKINPKAIPSVTASAESSSVTTLADMAGNTSVTSISKPVRTISTITAVEVIAASSLLRRSALQEVQRPVKDPARFREGETIQRMLEWQPGDAPPLLRLVLSDKLHEIEANELPFTCDVQLDIIQKAIYGCNDSRLL